MADNPQTPAEPLNRPSTLADLISALAALADLPPVERARACPDLIDAAKGVLARERAAAMAEATAPGGMSKAELARQLGISRSKVGEAITDYLTGPPNGGTPAPSPAG